MLQNDIYFTICAFLFWSEDSEAKGDFDVSEAKAFERALDLLAMSIWGQFNQNVTLVK